jgi:hypothetical protein
MMRAMLRAVALSLALAATPATAGLDDMTRARGALERGEVLPLAGILAKVEQELVARARLADFGAADFLL